MQFKEKYGKYALVTGASSGIGKEFAYLLAERGISPILVARREERLKEISLEITKKYNVESPFFKVDLTEEESYKTLFKLTEKYDIGLLVNNAGFGYYGKFINQDEEKQAEMIKLNVFTFAMLTKAFSKYFVEKGRGGIILVSSLAAFQPTAGMALYGATKGFELLLGEGFYEEIRGKNVDVTVLCPSATLTEFQSVAEGVPHKGMKARDVALCGIKSLGKRVIAIPGFWNKIVGKLYRFFPRAFVRWATKIVLGGYLKD
jgi:short-subunit dehydrogenase